MPSAHQDECSRQCYQAGSVTLDVFLNHVKSASAFISEVPSCHRKADAIGTERTHYVNQKGFRDLAGRISAK